MRRLVFLTGLALAVGVLPPGSAVGAAGGSDLPFDGRFSGYGTTTLATGQAHVVTSGPLSHFGLTAVEQRLQAVPTGPGTFNWFGTWTATAANGDQMAGTTTGTQTFSADGIHSTLLGTYTSSSGMGRFRGATLTFETTGSGTNVSVQGGVVTAFFEGTVVGALSY